MKIMNQFGKIHTILIVSLVVIFSIPTLLYHQYQLHGALTPAGKVIEVSGKVNELKYKREEKTVLLKLNDPLFYSDWIMTGPNSATRVLINDPQTKAEVAFFIYENSKFKVDKMLIEKTGQKKIVVHHTAGLLRFLTKGLKKGDELQIVTPTALVGVRGSDGLVQVAGGGGSTAGASNITMLRFTVTAGTDNPVAVKTVTLNTSSVSGAPISQTFNLGTPLTVSKNGTATIEVKMDTSTGQPTSVVDMGSGVNYSFTAADLDTSTQMNLGDGNIKINMTPSSAGTPKEAAGASTAILGKSNFTVHGENIKVESLKLTPTPTPTTSPITTVSLYKGDAYVAPLGYGSTTLDALKNFQIEAGTTMTVNFKGDVATGTAKFTVADTFDTVANANNLISIPVSPSVNAAATADPSTSSSGASSATSYNATASTGTTTAQETPGDCAAPATNTSETSASSNP